MLAETSQRQVSVRAEALPMAGPASPLATISEDAAMLAMIERAVRDPSVDVDKMERLMVMAERAAERRAKMAFAGALAELQPKLPVIGERGEIKNKAGGVTSTYALWEDVNEAIKPLLAEHGFALSFRTGRDDQGRLVVTGVLSHRDGHSEDTTLSLPVDDSGSKNSVQGVGSSVSYGKRYTAYALLNITTSGEDDDAQSAGSRIPAPVAAANAAINLCSTREELMAWREKNRDAIMAMPTEQADAVVRLFKSRAKAMEGQA